MKIYRVKTPNFNLKLFRLIIEELHIQIKKYL